MDEATTKTCPKCAESVLSAAQVCKHCGHRFEMRPWVPLLAVGLVALGLTVFVWNQNRLERERSERNVCELTAEMSGSDPSDC